MSERKEIARTIEEITASARVNMQDMINRAIGLGQDCIDAKETLGHGKFLPWLKELGLSSSTASNYMKVAREITPGSRLAQLSYSKALALLSAPAEEREQLAEETEGQSAAEIRRLIEERNKAAEAANAETTRADQWEDVARQRTIENDELKKQLEETEKKRHEAACEISQRSDLIVRLNNRIDKLKADLMTAENNVVEVEKVVEKVPEDYEQLKKNQQDLLEAAAAAEERAEAAEEELEALRHGTAPEEEPWKTLKIAVDRFMLDVNPLFMLSPDKLMRSESRMRRSIEFLSNWMKAFNENLDKAAVNSVDGTVEVI